MSDQSGRSVLQFAAAVRENVQRVIVGKAEAIDLALIALLCRSHALIEDVPGTGKTTMAKALADSLGCDFRRIQFTPDLVPADILGVNLYDLSQNKFEFRPGPIFTQVLLGDEINRATPRTQAALLEAMQEQQVSVDGVTSALPTPFLVLATLNPVEMEGTFPLPEAQLDRFMVRISLGYPSPEEELALLDRFQGAGAPKPLGAVTDPAEIALAQRAVDKIAVDGTVKRYILALAEATRQHQQFQLGASPRASLALQNSAQARAAISGRDYVLPDDVKALAGPILGHRLLLNAGARLQGLQADTLLAAILEQVAVPLES